MELIMKKWNGFIKKSKGNPSLKSIHPVWKGRMDSEETGQVHTPIWMNNEASKSGQTWLRPSIRPVWKGRMDPPPHFSDFVFLSLTFVLLVYIYKGCERKGGRADLGF